VGPLEEKLRREWQSIFDGLTGAERTALEGSNFVPPQEATRALLKQTTWLRESLFDLAETLDQLKGPGISS
jgi:hypothetical protein